MNKTTRGRLEQWEKSRNLGEEILQGIRDIKAGRVGRRFTAESFARAFVRTTGPRRSLGTARKGK